MLQNILGYHLCLEIFQPKLSYRTQVYIISVFQIHEYQLLCSEISDLPEG